MVTGKRGEIVYNGFQAIFKDYLTNEVVLCLNWRFVVDPTKIGEIN